MVESTALEMRHRRKPIGGSNPPLSAIKLARTRTLTCLMALIIIAPRCAAQAPPNDVDLQQLPPKLGDGDIVVGYSVKNLSAVLLQSVTVQCAAREKDGSLVAIGAGLVENLRQDEKAFGFINIPDTTNLNLKFQCRVSSISK